MMLLEAQMTLTQMRRDVGAFADQVATRISAMFCTFWRKSQPKTSAR